MRIVRSAAARAIGPEREHFTGDVFVARAELGDDPPMVPVVVSFAPGARTDWHVHPAGQTLFVLSGRGRVGLRDGRLEVFGPGDVVLAEAGEVHWHGAAPDSPMVHLSVTNEATVWTDEAVPDQTYDPPTRGGR
jgi:quercetin dioxygenase-like cupin family protein